ncbi:hypothetical protein ADIWIN_2863 [Winogradskyella psychrotolerans RS-3]|uniref:Anti-sigma factor n=1 Tax=Winogradskyella psychrotolerans RS-3 TaxID=641526 RepID=S7WZ15_9FLAO|nr:hypothetical protein [Winogradskyella psychrotolerans]EPR72024.1 hypothetical protein ADIWIN_2863 [Winogradskyella psychrotolerans RS-3]
MKQDIRTLFTEEDDLKPLPKNHRSEFADKLKKQSKPKQNPYAWLSAAAILIIALAIGFNVRDMESKPELNQVSPIIAQVEAVEAEYLKDIETEWQSFVAIADDAVLIERFRKKLKDLDTDYKAISVQFKDDSNNILVIEALVENLQTRLQILKDIQNHINILNQTNEQYENTI